jgi:hypothetical protein
LAVPARLSAVATATRVAASQVIERVTSLDARRVAAVALNVCAEIVPKSTVPFPDKLTLQAEGRIVPVTARSAVSAAWAPKEAAASIVARAAKRIVVVFMMG